MTQYIDKDALVAEIKRRKEINKYRDTNDSLFEDEAILSFISTLEVKEVNLEKEQLEELDIVSRGFASSRAEILESLYNDLKKL